MLLSGEPGIGKSRIAVALQERMRTDNHFRLRYYCSPHHCDSLLYPFISQIERAAGFSRDDGNEAKLDKLAALLLQSRERLLDAVPLFADLLALPMGIAIPVNTRSTAPAREIFATLIDQLEALTQPKARSTIVEDAHWAELHFARTDADGRRASTVWPVLLVITFRPEFSLPGRGRQMCPP